MSAPSNLITVEAAVMAPIEKVWEYWTSPQHIVQWNQASADWHCPKAENDLRNGGKFSATMAAKDGSMSFDFWGIHDAVAEKQSIESTMGDGRKMKVVFTAEGGITKVTESFEPENENPKELQQQGWQAILDNFKKYTETN